MGLVFLKVTQSNTPYNVLNFSCNCCCETFYKNEISQIMTKRYMEILNSSHAIGPYTLNTPKFIKS